MVYAILNLAYSKEYVLFIRLIYSKYVIWYHYSGIFYIILCDKWSCDSQIITLTLNSKSKIRKINRKENKNMKWNKNK